MADSARAIYDGPIALGMVFDFEPGKRHLYERLTVTKIEGPNIWARGRSGETYYEERDFRSGVVFVAERQPSTRRAAPAPLVKRYDGPIAVGMMFDFEPGKKHLYERLTVWKIEGENLYAFGRSGMTYYEEADFRQSVVPVAPDGG